MKFYFFQTILFASLFILRISAATDSLLVKIGYSGISVDEFQQRFELIPHVSKISKKNLEEKKQDLLLSLIAEKLWARNAEDLRLDTSEVMQFTFKIIEKMFVRDALYKFEISDRVKISDQEKAEGLNKVYFNIELEAVKLNDSIKAFDIYKKLLDGYSFDSIKTSITEQIPLLTVKYGELTEDVEKELFSLQENEISKPIKSNTGWIIFKLIKLNYEPIESRNKAIMMVEEIIRKRKTDELYNEFFEKFFKGKKIETDGTLFWSLVDRITDQLIKRKNEKSTADREIISLEISDLFSIENNLGADTLQMTLIKFQESPVTVKEFLRDLVFDGFSTDNLQTNTIARKLNARVRLFIEHELLSREGFKRGYNNLPEVKSSISMWRDNYLARILKNTLLDSIKITDDEIYNYYLSTVKNKNQAINEVNIIEILTDSLEVIETVLNELEKGTDIRSLASIHTKRTWTKSSGGEFGFFPVSMYGDIGRIASNMKIGEVYGPIKLPEGYSIFKLIDKKEAELDSSISFEDAKDELRKKLFYEKSAKFFIDYTVKLANKYGVEINEQLIKSVDVLDMNLFVFRYLGFGGRITAVPMVLPFNEWYKPWKESKKIVP